MNFEKRDFLSFILALGLCSVLSAKEIAVGPQGASPYLDSEVSTNVSFNVHRSDVRTFEPDAVADGSARFLHMNVATDAAFLPKRAIFANDAGACFADIAAACPSWLFSREWNLIKVTRRGPAASGELCRIRNDYRSFRITFR